MSAHAFEEEVLSFQCAEAKLWGILARPAVGLPEAPIAVLIAVGGPQYRIGSHRQFVLLARRLAAQGFASLRFDVRGMGDSEGEPRDFESVGSDLHAAVDALLGAGAKPKRVVVWGLCDAASAAMMHTVSHSAVAGLVLVNPWARSEASLAATHVKHYYGARLMQREFWRKLLRGGVSWRGSAGTLLSSLWRARPLPWKRSLAQSDGSFQTRMARGLASFRGKVLLIVAGADLTAKEFLQHAESSLPWRGLLASDRVSRVDVPDADHTFSCRAWRAEVEDATLAWLHTFANAPAR